MAHFGVVYIFERRPGLFPSRRASIQGRITRLARPSVRPSVCLSVCPSVLVLKLAHRWCFESRCSRCTCCTTLQAAWSKDIFFRF